MSQATSKYTSIAFCLCDCRNIKSNYTLLQIHTIYKSYRIVTQHTWWHIVYYTSTDYLVKEDIIIIYNTSRSRDNKRPMHIHNCR